MVSSRFRSDGGLCLLDFLVILPSLGFGSLGHIRTPHRLCPWPVLQLHGIVREGSVIGGNCVESVEDSATC